MQKTSQTTKVRSVKSGNAIRAINPGNPYDLATMQAAGQGGRTFALRQQLPQVQHEAGAESEQSLWQKSKSCFFDQSPKRSDKTQFKNECLFRFIQETLSPEKTKARNASKCLFKKQNLYMFPWICPLPCMKKIYGIDNGSHPENKIDHQPPKVFGKTILCFAYMSPVTSIVNRKLPEKT